ncbi:caspase-2-like [Haemaphysalis longicornis]
MLLPVQGMMEELSKAAQEEQQKAADCLVVVLMSHGGKDTIRGSDNEPLPQQCIYGSDDEPVALESICELFNNKNCPSLQGKPKLFFIQACRGRKRDAGVAKYVPPDRMDDAPVPSNLGSCPIQKVTTVSDACICYASVDNYVSYRNGATGSWFMSAICRVFSQHAHTMHLADLLLDVHGEVIERVSHQGTRKHPALIIWVGQSNSISTLASPLTPPRSQHPGTGQREDPWQRMQVSVIA